MLVNTSTKDRPHQEKNKPNNLVLTYPELSQEWHPTKNEFLTPQDVTFGSNKKSLVAM